MAGGGVLSPDPIKPNIGGPEMTENVRRGKVRMGFLTNRVTEESRQESLRHTTTPGIKIFKSI